jgi:hypothetical protein
MQDQIQMFKVTYSHVYFTDGFRLSAEFTEDRKPADPKSKHACMQSLYWCEQQIKEEGLPIIIRYLRWKGIRNPKTVAKAIVKYGKK